MVRADTDSASSSDVRSTLDEAIEHCMRALEDGELNIDALTSKYPEYESEIVEFLENWGGMESVAAVLAEQDDLHEQLETVDFEPRQFDDYELLKKVGAGGMGTIYKARQISLDRIVALKMIRAGQKDRERFQMEAEAVARLSHPGIVPIFEYGVHKGRQFFTMQFVEGCDLKQYVNQNPLAAREAAEILKTIAGAVHYAHQHGILHRDLKPANVLMDQQRQPYVTDFGLAKHIERDNDLTQSGAILGTPGYMAPEQASGKVKNLTTATDVYGLGALLYAMLTGEAPFTGDSSLQVLKQVVEDPARSPRQSNSKIDRDLETICLKCLEKSPEQRYSSASDLASDLTRYLNDEPVMARPVTKIEKAWRWCKRNRTVASLTAAVVTLMVATTLFATFLAYSERSGRQKEIRLNADVGRALEQATKERAHLSYMNGLWKTSNQYVGEALLWFSDATTIKGNDPDLIQKNLIRCQSWLRGHPMPNGAFRLAQKFCDDEGTNEITFDPDGSGLMYRSSRQFAIWDGKSEEPWDLMEAFPRLLWATWHPNGKSILIGSNDGKIESVDKESRQSVELASIESGVSMIRFVQGGQWLAVSSGSKIFFLDADSGEFVAPAIDRKSRVFEMVVNASGDRMVAISSNGESSVYSFIPDVSNVEDRVQSIFEFKCHYRSIVDQLVPVWPKFVMGDQVLLARTRDFRSTTFDVDTGLVLGQIGLPRRTYSISVAKDGESFVVGSFNYCQHYHFRNLKPPEEDHESGNELTGDKKTNSDAKQEPNNFRISEAKLEAELLERLEHDNRVSTTTISSKGLLATGAFNNEVRIWSPENVKSFHRTRFDVPEKATPIAVLPHQTRVRCIAFSPDGNHLVTVQVDGLVRRWKIQEEGPNGYNVDVQAGGSLVRMVDEDSWMTSGMSRVDGHMENATIFGLRDGTIRAGSKGMETSTHGHMLGAAVSPDRAHLATIHATRSRRGGSFRLPDGKGGCLRIWDLVDDKMLHESIPMPSEPRWVEWHPREDCLVVCTCLMEMVVVDTTTFTIREVWNTWTDARTKLPKRYSMPTNSINEEIRFTPDGKWIIARNSRHVGIIVWDFETGKIIEPFYTNQYKPIGGFDFSPDGKRVAIAGGKNPVARVFELEDHEFVGADLDHASVVHSANFSPDGDCLVTGSRDGYVRVFEWRSGELKLEIEAHKVDITDARFTPNADFIVTLGRDNLMKVWHADDGTLALKPIVVPAGSEHLAISGDSRYAIASGGHIKVADLTELHRQPQLGPMQARQISELLSNKVIVNGTMSTLSPDEWLERWRKLKPIESSQ